MSTTPQEKHDHGNYKYYKYWHDVYNTYTPYLEKKCCLFSPSLYLNCCPSSQRKNHFSQLTFTINTNNYALVTYLHGLKQYVTSVQNRKDSTYSHFNSTVA